MQVLLRGGLYREVPGGDNCREVTGHRRRSGALPHDYPCHSPSGKEGRARQDSPPDRSILRCSSRYHHRIVRHDEGGWQSRLLPRRFDQQAGRAAQECPATVNYGGAPWSTAPGNTAVAAVSPPAAGRPCYRSRRTPSTSGASPQRPPPQTPRQPLYHRTAL